MAMHTVVLVAATVMLFTSSGCAADQNDATSCSGTQMVNTSVTQPRSVLKLKCPDSYTVEPNISGGDAVDQVFTDSALQKEEKLSVVCPGATGTQSTSGLAKVVTFNITQLPQTNTTFYLKCYDGSSTACSFLVAVSGASPSGPQVCAVKNSSVRLAVVGQAGTAKFACGTGFELKPTTSTKAYNEDCSKEKELKDLTLSGSNEAYYVLTPKKTPKDEKYCYLCGTPGGAKGSVEESCRVLISVSAGSSLAARSAFGLALPFVLALLHFT